MKIGHVSPDTFLLLLAAAEHCGTAASKLLRPFHLSREDLANPGQRIGLTTLMKTGYAAIQSSQDPALGLYMGRMTHVSHLSLPGLLAMTAPTLSAALQDLTAYSVLAGRCYRGAPQLKQDRNAVQLCFYSIAPYNDYNRFVIDAVLGGWYTIIHWLTGHTGLVREIHLEYSAPTYQDRYREFFTCPILFDQPVNELVLEASNLQHPVIYQNPALHTTLKKLAEEKLRQLQQADSLRQRVQDIIGPRLQGHTPTLEETASAMGIPAWTLRRKLKEEGTTFQRLLEEMRRDLALSYMKDTTLSFGEIAFILGFSTPGAFLRAFKRWTDQTPGAYRREERRNGRL